MGPGFKYHVITISAIFFALTIGLVLGSLYVSPRLADKQTRAIVALQGKFNNEFMSQRRKLENYEKFMADEIPVLLKNKLSGINIAIIQIGDYPEALTKVKDALQLANAKVVSVTSVDHSLDRPDDALNLTLAGLHSDTPVIPADKESLIRELTASIAHGETGDNNVMSALDHAGLINIEQDSSYKSPVRAIIFVCGSRTENSTRPVNIDQPLITALQKMKLTIVACEPEKIISSDLAAYQTLNLDIIPIENVDTDIGRCALVFALRENHNGSPAKSSDGSIPSDASNGTKN